MIQISMETKALMDKLIAIRTKGLKYAVSMAMTWLATDARDAFQKEIDTKVDRPTPTTQKASRMLPATADRTEYDVYVQDKYSSGSDGIPPSKYLLALLMGGYRANKRSENLLRAKGILPPGFQIEPGADAPKDAYGNMRGGGSRMVQILSGLQAFRETKFKMNRTNASMERAIASGKPMKEFFVLYSTQTKTPTGVYTRSGRGGKKITQLLKFTPKRAKYSKLLNFQATIDRVFHENFEARFQEGLRRMIEKVKSW